MSTEKDVDRMVREYLDDMERPTPAEITLKSQLRNAFKAGHASRSTEIKELRERVKEQQETLHYLRGTLRRIMGDVEPFGPFRDMIVVLDKALSGVESKGGV